MRSPPSAPWVLALATLGALLVAACGGSSAGPQIRSIDEILVGEIAIAELGPTGGIVVVQTSIPVVCSVVFGTDTSYGSQSTDLDMAGRAHESHAAPLFDLEPDTTYHYRLQGTGSDGSVYVSKDRSFRTPAAEEVSPPAPNLALEARVVDVSSEFSDAWSAANAIDGDFGSEWSSAGDGDGAFLEIALAGPAQLEAIGVATRTMGNTAQISSFRVVTDGGDVLGPFDLPQANRLFIFPVEVRASGLRFEVVNSSGGNTGLVEFAAYGAASDDR